MFRATGSKGVQRIVPAWKGFLRVVPAVLVANLWSAGARAEIVVTTTAELEAALTPANAGEEIVVRAGEYVVSAPLSVPK